ncbi:MAG: ChaN family lipoprotein [Pseudomonadota bacterium]|nr:ChaN family lipoprotein [Pseudomonadota bacterium]
MWQPQITSLHRRLKAAGWVILLIMLSLPDHARGREDIAPSKQTDHKLGHVLVGQIWDVATQRFMSADDFYARLAHADFVLLGEIHTNRDHHRLQRRVIERMVAQGRRPAVVFEMFERANQPTIERVRNHHPNDADRLAHETHMEARGWPWRLYKPLIKTVLTDNLPMFGADLSRSTIRKIMAEGLEALDAQRIKSLALNEPLAPRDIAIMRTEIITAHCGNAPERLIDGMIAAQRARDASLADGLIEHANRNGAVLIAGSGHVRNDYATPAYLHRRAPDKAVLSVAFTEIVDDKREPQDYLPATSTHAPVFDYLWFTPRAGGQNPCAQFKKHLRTLHRAASR